MESNHNYFKCVICNEPALYVMGGDSLCEKHRDQAQMAFMMLKARKVENEEEN